MNKPFKIKSILSLVLIIGLLFYFTDDSALAAKVDRQAPTAPTNLKTSAITETSITLTWDASSDNVEVKAYDIYKNNRYLISTAKTTYTISGLTPGTVYEFYIKAKDARKNVSASSNILAVKTATATEETPIDTPISETPTSGTTISKKIIGYYAAWSAYSGYTPDKIDSNMFTHINYSFANIGQDLRVTPGYPDIDINNYKMLQALKVKNPNLKTLISVGGWSWSGKFSDAALTDASRKAFADSCVNFIVQYGFDGVDIDWEYPVSGGLSTNVRRPEDKQNFTLLLKTIREKLDAREAIDNKEYLLTIAGGAGGSFIQNTEVAVLQQYIDFANIMTYDIHGPWDTYTDFNAPLYNSTDASPQYKLSVDSSVKAWINAGLPKDKLVMGVPFYGYLYNAVKNENNGLYQTFTGTKSLSSSDIRANYLNSQGYVRYFHSQSMVPWLFNGTSFISYEDEQSIGLKADYVKTQGLAGASIWEISQDPDKVLLNALYNGLK